MPQILNTFIMLVDILFFNTVIVEYAYFVKLSRMLIIY